ncbi:MAG: DUF616 domain-containing protein [Candidatus Diapherotrites archaeon]|jgi:O-antigen/teichoic acid export membrane protein|nr:DUF616 domain-containing protein [Candidatus Diapherotrites archaeon]MBT4596635.1 DUF616 domain-containing protein [Candidatus Diapherotrites archaeon]
MAQLKGFTKNIIFEQSKKIIMVVTGILFTYIIAQYLGPVEYGLVLYFIGFMAIINLFGVSMLQSIISAFMPKWKSKNVFIKSVKYQYLIVIPVVIAITIFSEPISVFLGKGPFELLQLAAVLQLIMPIHMSYLFLFRSFKMFGKTFKIESVMQASVLVFAILFVIIFGFGMYGVIYAQMVSAIVCILMSTYYFRSVPFKNTFIDKTELIKYGKFGYPTSLVRHGYNQLIIILMGIFISPLWLGYYYLIEKISGAFIGKSTSTITDVLFPYLVEKHSNKKVLGDFVSLGIKTNALISAIFGGVLLIITQPLLQIFLPDFVDAYVLLPLYVLVSILGAAGFMEHLFVSLNKMKILLKIKAISAVSTSITAIILLPWFGVWGLLFSMIIYQIIFFCIAFYYTKRIGVHVSIIPNRKDLKYAKTIIAILKKSSIHSIQKMIFNLFSNKKRFRKVNSKIVVYTAIFGDKDSLKATIPFDGVDYICFTDNKNLKSESWKIKVINPEFKNPRKNARKIKVFPPKIINNYTYSLWVDGTHTPITNPRKLIARYLGENDLIRYKHHQRDTLLKEANAVIAMKKDKRSIVEKQIKRYLAEGFPLEMGLTETTILLRKNKPKIIEMNKMWWNELHKNSIRDQMSFDYSCWKTKIKCAKIPGNVFRSFHFNYKPHKR